MTQQAVSVPGDPILLATCVQVLNEYLDEQLEALANGARDALLVAARDAGDHDEEERLISVMEEVEALAPAACDAFRDSMMAKLRSPDEGLANPFDEEGDAGMSLVDTAKVDDWVRMRRMLQRHSQEARALEGSLRLRLAYVAGASPHPDDTPVSLPGVCVLFQAEMQKLGAGREARAVIYDAFEGTVVARLSNVVSRLDAVLRDVTPPGGADSPAAPGVSSGTETESDAPGGSSTVELGPAAPGASTVADKESSAPVDADDDSVEPVRLLGAIAAVERQMRFVSGERARNTEELERQLGEALTPPGVILGDEERLTVAAVASLLQHALEHPGVDAAVRARLWRLAPPLVLLALQDDDYLDLELQAARHDPLTGLLDRAAFRTRLQSALGGASGRSFAVCLVDVDGFRDIVARVGQQVAGRLLRALAELLRQHAGGSGRVARLRGDEFGVLLPSRRAGTGRRFAERYSTAVEEARFVVAGEEMVLTLSIGVVEPDGALTSPAEVMRAADAARKAAKLAGGARVRVHGETKHG